MANRATLRRKGKAASCTFYIWFRHPVLNKPLERSLKTSDERHANTLVECLDLILADPAWHRRVRPGTPVEIVGAFYDPIKNQLSGVQHFEDPPTNVVVKDDGTMQGWNVSPSKQAAADKKVIDESFDALRWRQRCDRLKKMLRKKDRTIVLLSRKIGDIERRQSGKGTPPISEAFELFDAVLKVRVAKCTYNSRKPRLQKFVDAMEDRLVGSIKPTDIDDYLLSILGRDDLPVSALTRKNTRVDIGTFLNWSAKRWGYMSPMIHTERIRGGSEQQEIVYLTQNEVDVMLDECKDLYWRTLLAVHVYSGIRAAELRWLQVEDVDTQRNVIQVRTVSTPHETKVPKTGPRAVHYHEKLQPYLADYIAAGHPGKRFFFPKIGEQRSRFKHGGEPDVWRGSALTHVFADVLKPLSAKVGKTINALVLRHTFGSLMIRAGFNYIEVSTIMGNSPEICRRHYARLSPDEIRASWPSAAKAIPDPTVPLVSKNGDTDLPHVRWTRGVVV